MEMEASRFREPLLRERVEARLAEAGAGIATRQAAVRAMLHASLVGIDSHGVRLTEHYCRMLAGGRLNREPNVQVELRGAGSAMVDGDDGMGHLAAYTAVETGIALARGAGVGAVGVRRSSHLGAAGAYALAGAEQGFVTFATTNTDSMVALFGGAEKFHGTNPLAFAAPVPEGRPWLLDMATSSIPLNRVLLHRSLDKPLPEGVVADAEGTPTTDPHVADMLMPLGGVDYGYKGAGLAGVATLFSALLTGTTLDPDFIPMYGSTDISTPRNMGHFVLVVDPDRFAGRAVFLAGIRAYLDALRSSAGRPGAGPPMAPGDREWATMDQRRAEGIPIDPDTQRYLGL